MISKQWHLVILHFAVAYYLIPVHHKFWEGGGGTFLDLKILWELKTCPCSWGLGAKITGGVSVLYERHYLCSCIFDQPDGLCSIYLPSLSKMEPYIVRGIELEWFKIIQVRGMFI